MPPKKDRKRRSIVDDDSPDHAAPKRQKLEGEQLAKKREYDRQAQRAAREKTRAYITHLENLVDSLQKNGDSDHETVQLAQRLNESQAEVARLKKTLGSIARLTGATTVERSTSPDSQSERVQVKKQDDKTFVLNEEVAHGNIAVDVFEPDADVPTDINVIPSHLSSLDAAVTGHSASIHEAAVYDDVDYSSLLMPSKSIHSFNDDSLVMQDVDRRIDEAINNTPFSNRTASGDGEKQASITRIANIITKKSKIGRSTLAFGR